MSVSSPSIGGNIVQRQSQETKPSIPLKSSNPRDTLGDSGIRSLHGFITEEYNPQLQGIQGIKVYDEMRKSDGTCRAAMLSCTLPIRRAEWFVNPATPEDQDKEIANFVEHALFDWLDMTWADFIRQALIMVPLGVMVFEKVYGVKDFDGKTYVTLQKLAPRMPGSIQQWELTDGTFGIQQNRQDGVVAQIPGSKLLTFVNEREGDNWWGTSFLRAAYKHWYRKEVFYKIDALAFERQGLGVPYIKMPQGYTEADEKQATKVLQNIRANETSYLLLPPAYEAGFLDMGSNSTRDPNPSISHHNREILKSVLAQFLDLGSQGAKSGGTGGSKSLSNDHSELFLKGLEAIANTIIDEINKNLIPELVDLNFNDVKTYPVLDYAGIDKVDIEALGNAYAQLVTAGAIKPTEDDEQYMRTAMGLPPRTQEDMQDTDTLDQEDHIDNDEPGDSNVDTAGDVADSVDTATADAGKNKVQDAGKKKAHEHKHKALVFDNGNGFKSWRKLTFAEQKVNWSKIQDTMDQMEADLSARAKEVLKSAKDAFMAKLHEAMKNGDTKAVAALEIKFSKDYKALIKSAMQDAYTYGKSNVSAEMGVQTPANTASSMAQIDLMADTIATKAMADLESKAKIATANAMKQDTPVLQAIGTIDATLDDAIAQTTDAMAGTVIGQSINGGRADVFERNQGMIYALQRSEVLDKNTCDFCLSMDGLVIQPTSEWAKMDTFHTNCRGIWVEILTDEQNPPEVTDVPSNLGDYYGGQTNQLVQPPRPIVRPDSPAATEVARRAEAKKK